jgi:hypothetical protein
MFLQQMVKDLDKETDEYKWLKAILPADYLNTILAEQQVTTSQPVVTTGYLSKSKLNPGKKKSSIDETPSANMQQDDLINEPVHVIIININDKGFDCPGMLSEHKVLQEYEALNTNTLMPGNIEFVDDNRSFGRHPGTDTDICDGNSSVGFNLDTTDNCSNDNGPINMNQDNQSLSSSNDDANIMNPIDNDEELIKVGQEANDGLESEFNFSGRDTPIISGRDTPSSHSQGGGGVAGENANIRHNSSGNIYMSNMNQQTNFNMMTNPTAMSNNQLSNNSFHVQQQRGPNLPVTVQKENRDDINEKFCKFEINKSKTVFAFRLDSTCGSLEILNVGSNQQPTRH